MQLLHLLKEVLYHEHENEYNKLIDEAKNVLEINKQIIESFRKIQDKQKK